MHKDVEKVLFTEEQIKTRVKELGAEISRDYADKNPLMLGILNGAVVFFSDLIREIPVPLNVDFMAISSYGMESKSTGVVRILKDLNRSIDGQHIIIVADKLDSGLTLSYLLSNLQSRRAGSLEVCVLLDKPERRVSNVNPRYIGFTIPDEFIIGYGLDYSERYRNLPYIGVLKREVYETVP